MIPPPGTQREDSTLSGFAQPAAVACRQRWPFARGKSSAAGHVREPFVRCAACAQLNHGFWGCDRHIDQTSGRAARSRHVPAGLIIERRLARRSNASDS
jgi:hypothetical protein